ncbi:hypothetical protein HV99_19990 [Pseudomonas aeruginosa]|nr:hypothetical protein HV99_19990 [Pseudomonas aeruginosa]
MLLHNHLANFITLVIIKLFYNSQALRNYISMERRFKILHSYHDFPKLRHIALNINIGNSIQIILKPQLFES